MLRRGFVSCLAALQLFMASPAPAQSLAAPQSPVLTVDQNRLFALSAWGRRAQADLEAEGQKIAAEHERIAAALSAEEESLTAQRQSLEPAEFRTLAEAFDSRATEIRRERAQVVEDLNARAEADRDAFYQAAFPVMAEMMHERGALAVLDRRTVFISVDAIDITDDLVERLDASLGSGPSDLIPSGGDLPAPDGSGAGD